MLISRTAPDLKYKQECKGLREISNMPHNERMNSLLEGTRKISCLGYLAMENFICLQTDVHSIT